MCPNRPIQHPYGDLHSPGRPHVVHAFRVFLIVAVLLLGAGAALARQPDVGDSGSIEVLRPRIPASRAVVLRVAVDEDVAVGKIIFWVRRGRTAYQEHEAVPGRDGAYETRMVWHGGTKAVHYFVDVLDRNGEILGRRGDPMRPFQAYFSPESFKRKDRYGAQRIFFAVVLVVAHLYALNVMRRQDRWDRLRLFWLRLLAPLAPLRGHSLMRAVDRVLRRIPKSRMPEEVESPRLLAIGWINEIRDSRSRRRRRDRRKKRLRANAGA